MTVMDPETVELHDIDIDLPCDVNDRDTAASWLVVWAPEAFVDCGCRPRQLMCTSHLEYLAKSLEEGRWSVCTHGEIVGRLRDLVIKFEPI